MPYQCGTPLAQVFFLLFTMVVAFICLNLVIAVVLEAFEDASGSDHQEGIATFMAYWKDYDPDYEMHISTNKEIKVSRKVGSSDPGFADLPIKIATFCKLPISADHKVHFVHVLEGALRLMAALNGGKDGLTEEGELQERMDEIDEVDPVFMKLFKAMEAQHLGGPAALGTEGHPLEVHVAAAKIQALFQARKARKEAMKVANSRRRPCGASGSGDQPPAEPGTDDAPKFPDLQEVMR